MSADGGVGESCGDGGALSLIAAAGAITSAVVVKSTTAGSDCEGGSILLEASSVTVAGDLDARGGASASSEAITVHATGADVTIAPSATLRADGTGQPDGFGSDGGDVVLVADAGRVVLRGPTFATGKSPSGAGGSVVVAAAGDVELDGRVTVAGGLQGAGGTVIVDAASALTVGDDIVATGGSSYPFGVGGLVDLYAVDGVEVRSTLDASGAHGGDVFVTGLGPAVVSGSAVVRGNTFGRRIRYVSRPTWRRSSPLHWLVSQRTASPLRRPAAHRGVRGQPTASRDAIAPAGIVASALMSSLEPTSRRILA